MADGGHVVNLQGGGEDKKSLLRGRRPDMATALGVLLSAIGFSITARLTADNSLLTHVATGQLILDSGSVPTVDPYSSHFSGQSWTVQSWFASVVYAATVEVGGFSWLRVLHGWIGFLLVAGFWQVTAAARSLAVRVGLTVGLLVVADAFWSPRPLLFGLVGLLAVVLALEGRLKPMWLVAVMWVWVNTHGSFPLAAILWGTTVVGTVLDAVLARRSGVQPVDSPVGAVVGAVGQVPNRLWRVGFAVVAGTLAGAISPLGPRLLWFPFATVLRRQSMERVVEWQPPTFSSAGEIVYLLLIAAVALAATRRRFGWRYLLPVVAFVAVGFLAVRNIAPGAMVALGLLANGLESEQRVGAPQPSTARSSGPAILGVVGGLLLVLALAAGASLGPGLNLDRYPVSAVDYLEDRGLVASEEVSLVHREAVGNYLTFRYGNEASVYMDDRFDFYPLERTSDHLDLVYGGRYDEVLAKVEASVVLWQSDGLLAEWLRRSDGWSMAFEDDEWIVACRKSASTFDRCMD